MSGDEQSDQTSYRPVARIGGPMSTRSLITYRGKNKKQFIN